MGAAGLSGRLTNDDVKEAAATLSLGSIHRAWTAAAIPNDDLGLDIGVETTFLFRRGLLDQGNGTAIIPRIIPVPRFWLSWDLPAEFQVSASFAPGMFFDGVMAVGSGLQWTYLREEELGVAASLVGTYTYSDAFGDLRAHTFSGAAQISRDLDAWQPYAGAGFALSSATARSPLVLPGMSTKASPAVVHFYFGARVDLMAKLAFQVDFMNTNVSCSGLMSTSF